MTRLTSESAARIAKANGLGIPDAAALLQLAETEEQAEAMAGQFASLPDPGEMARAVEDRLGR